MMFGDVFSTVGFGSWLRVKLELTVSKWTGVDFSVISA